VVDFADVSTVMRNGGSAILGSAVAAGENRAYEAVENAINSPLLNDCNIAGAKWVLLNINSAHGIHEHTLDEVEMIQAYVQDQAGEECDVIFGTGFDDNLGENISVTIIATGFQHNNTEKAYSTEVKKPYSERNKEIYVLGEVTENNTSEMSDNEEPTASVEETPTAVVDTMAPTMHIIEEPAIPNVLSIGMGFARTMMRPTSQTAMEMDVVEESKVIFELTPAVEETLSIVEEPMIEFNASTIQEEIIEEPIMRFEEITTAPIQMDVHNELEKMFSTTMPEMSIEEKIENPIQDEYVTVKGITLNRRKGSRLLTDSELEAEANFELQKRAFDDRASKLRSMSFNVNKADIDNDESNIPAYMRSGLQLESHPASNEEVYSNVNVLDGNQNNSPITNRNSFLNGKVPD
jgi:cell division protein FtsZ